MCGYSLQWLILQLSYLLEQKPYQKSRRVGVFFICSWSNNLRGCYLSTIRGYGLVYYI